MKDLLTRIPGFRTDKNWKKIISLIFYITFFALLLSQKGITIKDTIIMMAQMILMLGIPFILIFNVSGLRNKLLYKNSKLKIVRSLVGIIMILILTLVAFTSLNTLKSDEQQAIDNKESSIASVNSINEKIAMINGIPNITLEDQEEIFSLFMKYDKLDDESKKMILESDKLVDAYDEINKLLLTEEEKGEVDQERDKAKGDKAEIDRIEAERVEKEQLESEKAKAAEIDRIEAERVEKVRLESEKAKAEEDAAKNSRARMEAFELENMKKEAKLNPGVLTEEIYKSYSSDVSWSDVVSNPELYEGSFLVKDLMVREIIRDGASSGYIYICGEKKGDRAYTGGTFYVYDQRIDKSHKIQLYDKIAVHGVLEGVYQGWNAPVPHLYIGYLEFQGKFGEE